MKPIVISIAAAKGGVAKSTSSWALASYLSKSRKVLMWDNDPQRTLSSALVNLDDVRFTAFDVICNKVEAKLATVKALPDYQNVDLIAGGNLLTGVETLTSSNIDRQFIFADAVSNLSSYNFLIFDCPSSQGLLTTGPLVASDVVISPVACAPAAFESLQAFEETVKVIQRRLNPKLQWFILPTLYDARQLLDQEVLAELHKQYGSIVLGPPIRKRISLAQDMAAQRACDNEDYEAFTNNFLQRILYEKQQTICSEELFDRARSPP